MSDSTGANNSFRLAVAQRAALAAQSGESKTNLPKSSPSPPLSSEGSPVVFLVPDVSTSADSRNIVTSMSHGHVSVRWNTPSNEDEPMQRFPSADSQDSYWVQSIALSQLRRQPSTPSRRSPSVFEAQLRHMDPESRSYGDEYDRGLANLTPIDAENYSENFSRPDSRPISGRLVDMPLDVVNSVTPFSPPHRSSSSTRLGGLFVGTPPAFRTEGELVRDMVSTPTSSTIRAPANTPVHQGVQRTRAPPNTPSGDSFSLRGHLARQSSISESPSSGDTDLNIFKMMHARTHMPRVPPNTPQQHDYARLLHNYSKISAPPNTPMNSADIREGNVPPHNTPSGRRGSGHSFYRVPPNTPLASAKLSPTKIRASPVLNPARRRRNSHKKSLSLNEQHLFSRSPHSPSKADTGSLVRNHSTIDIAPTNLRRPQDPPKPSSHSAPRSPVSVNAGLDPDISIEGLNRDVTFISPLNQPRNVTVKKTLDFDETEEDELLLSIPENQISNGDSLTRRIVHNSVLRRSSDASSAGSSLGGSLALTVETNFADAAEDAVVFLEDDQIDHDGMLKLQAREQEVAPLHIGNLGESLPDGNLVFDSKFSDVVAPSPIAAASRNMARANVMTSVSEDAESALWHLAAQNGFKRVSSVDSKQSTTSEENQEIHPSASGSGDDFIQFQGGDDDDEFNNDNIDPNGLLIVFLKEPRSLIPRHSTDCFDSCDWLTKFSDTMVQSTADGKQSECQNESDEYLSDDEITSHIVWKLYYWWAKIMMWFYDLTFEGTENIPKDSASLFILNHSTHNTDIFIGIGAFYKSIRTVPRGLFHRILFQTLWFLPYLGGVAGERSTASKLLNLGYSTACVPGGGEEAVMGHDHAYELQWTSSHGRPRKGFAYVALAAKNVPIIPTVIRNQEEMRWNVFYYIANRSGFTSAYQHLCEQVAHVPYVGSCLTWMRFLVWFNLSWFGFYIPVKVTYVYGEPIYPKENETAESLALRARKAMEILLKQNHANCPSTNFRGALAERFPRIFGCLSKKHD